MDSLGLPVKLSAIKDALPSAQALGEGGLNMLGLVGGAKMKTARALGEGAGVLHAAYDAELKLIGTKFASGTLTPSLVQELAAGFPKADRTLASHFLSLGAHNSSDFALASTLKEAYSQIRPIGPQVHSASAESSGNLLGYMYLKANDKKVWEPNAGVRSLSEYTVDWNKVRAFYPWGDHYLPPPSGAPVMLFDDVSRLPEKTRAYLAEFAKERTVVAVDLHNFDKGINFTDFAKGTVQPKLSALIAEAKVAKSKFALSDQEAVAHVLHFRQDEAAGRLGIQLWRPKLDFERPAYIPDLSPRKLNSYFERTYDDRQLRHQAAQFIGNTVQFRPLHVMARESGQLPDAVVSYLGRDLQPVASSVQDITAAGKRAHKDVVYVSGADGRELHAAIQPSKSSGAMTYLYRQMSGLPSEQFVTTGQLMEMHARGLLAGKQLVRHDDIAYSGTQATQVSSHLLKTLNGGGILKPDKLLVAGPRPHVLNVTLESYKPARDDLGHGFSSFFDGERTGASLVSLAEHLPLRRMAQHRDLLTAGEAANYHHVHSYHILPSRVSDTTTFVASDFAKRVLEIGSL